MRRLDGLDVEWEWIVIDDHSRDETFTVLSEIMRAMNVCGACGFRATSVPTLPLAARSSTRPAIVRLS